MHGYFFLLTYMYNPSNFVARNHHCSICPNNGINDSINVNSFTHIQSDLYAGAIFIEQSLKLDTYASIFALLAVAAVFTITGGLTAVVWTDFVQTILMIIGAIALTAIGRSIIIVVYHVIIVYNII